MNNKLRADLLGLALATRHIARSVVLKKSEIIDLYIKSSSIFCSRNGFASGQTAETVAIEPQIQTSRKDTNSSDSTSAPTPVSVQTILKAEKSVKNPKSVEVTNNKVLPTHPQPTKHIDLKQSKIPPAKRAQLKQSKVPASRFARLMGYGGIASSLAGGVIAEATKRFVGASQNTGSFVMTDGNITKLVDGLSRMRGAALKLGQMLSIQDNNVLSPQLEAILSKVQNSANYMPNSQLESILIGSLGKDWESKFKDFNRTPIAAASLGQVHEAHLPSGEHVAVKVQYPGVAASIDSDLDNLKALLLFSNVLPKGLYLDNTIRVAREELKLECDYIREAKYMRKYGELVKADPKLSSIFSVPQPISHLSTSQVLVSQFVPGVPIGEVAMQDQATRNFVGASMLRLSLSELFKWKLMQTDPNWTNFLFDASSNRVHLIDFGAAREYEDSFISKYHLLLKAAAIKDRKVCVDLSVQLGFLSGIESEVYFLIP